MVDSEASIPDSVDVSSVSAPTYEDVHPESHGHTHGDGHSHDHDDEPYVPPKREAVTYEAIALPSFTIPEYKPVEKPKPEPKPKPEVKPHVAEALKGGDDDIWGSYLAKYSKPAESYKPVVKAPEPWKPRPYQAFDFSKYALKAREAHQDVGYDNDKGNYWWEDQYSERKPAKANAPWWEEMTYDMDSDYKPKPAQHYKPTY